MEAIVTLNDIKAKLKNGNILFDLDGTLIATVFTNSMPKKCMKYYKVGESERRYSILRPGVDCVLEQINQRYSIVLITDAKQKRARTILEQFGLEKYVKAIISRECLIEFEKKFNMSRIGKPIKHFMGDLIFDDKAEVKNQNGIFCSLVPMYLARYDEYDQLWVKGYREVWQLYNAQFIEEESIQVLKWYDEVRRIKNV